MTFFVYILGVITIIYASISTLRTEDVKELIAYSSVSHAAIYLMALFSNTIQGIEGGMLLGLAHGLTSSGLFICVGGILYDRTHTRLIFFYKGLAQILPLFSIFFYLLCLSNCATPLTLNFVGEFMSLYGIFERLCLLGVFASLSIIFSAAYTIFMFNRITFAGSFSKFFLVNIFDLSKREFTILLTLIVFIIFLGIYPSCLLDGLHYSTSSLLFLSDFIEYCVNDEIITQLFEKAKQISSAFLGNIAKTKQYIFDFYYNNFDVLLANSAYIALVSLGISGIILCGIYALCKKIKKGCMSIFSKAKKITTISIVKTKKLMVINKIFSKIKQKLIKYISAFKV
jgi:NADH:ubiquinone oxidoreductase subunit 5 (subunit L)/multisubunit Na+/H+ antiporter MnhA subunit